MKYLLNFGICKGVKKFTNQLKTMESMNKRYNDNALSKNVLTEAQPVPDELAQDFTKKPFYKINPNERIKKDFIKICSKK